MNTDTQLDCTTDITTDDTICTDESIFAKTADLDIEKTGFGYTLSLISGRYKMLILYYLVEFKVARYNAIKRAIPKISHKTLSTTLKELEADGLVHREAYHQIPPKVEYSLTETGLSLMPVIDSMCYWGARASSALRAGTRA